MSRKERRMKKRMMSGLQVTLVAMLLVAGVFWTRAADDAEANDFILPSTTGEQLTFSGMALRLDPKRGPYIHGNASHYPRGFKEVYIDQNRGYLTVKRDRFDSVVSIITDPDETLTARGITIGSSGGGVITNLYFYQNGRLLNLANPKDYAIVAGVYSNVWLTIISQPNKK